MTPPETHHPAEPETADWRCGAITEGFSIGGLEVPAEVCYLPAGHEGWHRADSGYQWRDQEAMA